MRPVGLFQLESDTVTSFKLSSGVVVETARHRIYAMSVDGGIAAVDFSNGKHIWVNNAAAKPLGMAADRLVCQAEAAGKPNDLKIVATRPGNRGQGKFGQCDSTRGRTPVSCRRFEGRFCRDRGYRGRRRHRVLADSSNVLCRDARHMRRLPFANREL